MARKRYQQNNKSNSQEKQQKRSSQTDLKEGSSKESPENIEKEVSKGTNDVDWYNQIPELLRDSANIPFSLPYGAPINTSLKPREELGEGKFVAEHINKHYAGAPGVCTVYTNPAIGHAPGRVNDPINVAANSLYAFMRINATGRKNYDPSDAMIYCLAFAEIYSFVFFCQRTYGLALMYSQKNYYLAGELLRAAGFDPERLRTELATFRYWLNAYINKVSSFAIPNNIYYFNRRAFMYANYYIENPYGNVKDAMYQFAPAGFWKLDYNEGALDGTAGMPRLNIKHWIGHSDAHSPELPTYSFEDLQDFGEDLLANLSGNEDMGIISSDIIRAFGSNLISLAPLPEDYTLMPVYDPFVLSQFKNANPFTLKSNTSDLAADKYVFWDQYNGDGTSTQHSGYYGNVYVNQDGYLVSKQCLQERRYPDFQLASQLAALSADSVMSVENADPGIGDVIEATRLMVGRVASNATDPAVLYCGSDIAVGYSIVYRANSAAKSNNNNPYRIYLADTTIGTTDIVTDLIDSDDVYQIAKFPYTFILNLMFKYAPMRFEAIVYPHGNVDVQSYNVVSNLENTTLVPNASLKRMHECALLSMFYVPGIARLV